MTSQFIIASAKNLLKIKTLKGDSLSVDLFFLDRCTRLQDTITHGLWLPSQGVALCISCGRETALYNPKQVYITSTLYYISATNTTIYDMKSSLIPADIFEPGYTTEQDTPTPGGGGVIIESPPTRVRTEESFIAIPQHPLGVRPSGNKYTATSNAKDSVGIFQLLPDELIAIFLEYLDATELCLLGSTCKYLYTSCRSDDIWKTLFIE
jgi:hypothetical protein